VEVFRSPSPHELYRHQLDALNSYGSEVVVRGLRTKELLDVATVIEKPDRRVHIVPGRWANPFLALSEALHILGGRHDVASLLPYNKHILNFSDDGVDLYGAYGRRIKDQIPHILNRLRADPNDRRAILSIWEDRDLDADTKDPPCNDIVAFKLREDRLYMTIFNRSNDLHWGLYAVNLPTFSILQEYLAARLQVQLGTQTHISNSLHIYTGDHPGAKITKRMFNHMAAPLPVLPESGPLFPSGLPSHDYFVASCNDVLEQRPYGGDSLEEEGVAFLEFASDFLRCYRDWKSGIGSSPWDCRHADLYMDWIWAAEEFWHTVVKHSVAKETSRDQPAPQTS